MWRLWRQTLGLALLLSLPFALSAELTFPALTGRVVDEAGLLSARERDDLSQRLASFERSTSNQLVVVTLSSLGELSIEEYGYQLGRAWGIGTREHNNGVLLIIAPNERKVRIEVGYGLEGALPDAIAANIIQSQILPAFKHSNMAAGVSAGVASIIQATQGEYKPKKVSASSHNELLFLLFVCIFIGIPLLRLFGPFCLREALRGGVSSRGGWGGSGRGSGGGFSGGGGGFGGGGASGSW